MIINHTKKFVYLRVPKTGSTSFESQLIEDMDKNDDVVHTQIPFSDIPNLKWDYSTQQSNFTYVVNNPHLTYNEILPLLNVDISSYDVYGVLRNPVDRFLSRAYHMEYFQSGDNRFTTRAPDTTLNNNQVAEKLLNEINENPNLINYDSMHKPQTQWLLHDNNFNIQINNIFLYEDLPNMMKKITGNSVLRYNYRSQARENKNYDDLDSELQKQIITLYNSDYVLYNIIKNKTV